MSKTKNKAESVSALIKNDFVTSILKRLQLLKQETETKAAKKRGVSHPISNTEKRLKWTSVKESICYSLS